MNTSATVDEMRQAAERQPPVMSVVLHSIISSQPLGLRALRRALEHILKAELWITHPGAIARHVQSLSL